MKPKRPRRMGVGPDPEKLDDTPVAMPLGCEQPESLDQKIARYVGAAIQSQNQDEFETFDEANDFDEPEEPGLLDFSPYELKELEPEPEPEAAPEPAPAPESEPEPEPEPAPGN